VDERLFLRPDGQPMAWADAVQGGRAVGTPGLPQLLATAHREGGRLPWAALFQPAIESAEQGFPVSARLHQALTQATGLREDPAARQLYFDAQGQAWPVGHRLRNPALARTLRQLASEGVSAFYHGALAQELADRVRQHPTNPGQLALQDLADYAVQSRAALCHHNTFAGRRYRICGAPPPSSGALTVGQILGLLERAPAWFPPTPQKLPDVGWVHAFTEASRLAYADRNTYIADPAFTPAPTGDWASLLAPAYLQSRARALPVSPATPSMLRAPAGRPDGAPQAWAPMPDQPEQGTTHLSIIDGQGQAVSLTSSIESSFGARLMVGGFILNNQLTDFSFSPRDASGRPVANRVEPGKRPRSSMSPTLVFDDQDQRLLAVLGSPGGALIIPYVAQTLLAVLQEQRTPQQAVSLPHVASLNGPTLLEADRFPEDWQQALRALGVPVQTQPMASGLHVLVDVGAPGAARWATGIDPRREGAAAGD
jgi:gamma-glutamyltranspeptidase/glutathione hydrolase